MNRAIEGMRKAVTYAELNREWAQFLIAAHGIYSKLKEGARGCNKSEPWLGNKKHERKSDELLNYVHKARNSEEHGLDPTIANGYKIEPPATGTLLLEAVFHENKDITFHIQGDPAAIVRLPLTGALQAVTDQRSGITFHPPSIHLGLPVEDPSAFGVSALAARYLEALVEEAATLPQRT